LHHSAQIGFDWARNGLERFKIPRKLLVFASEKLVLRVGHVCPPVTHLEGPSGGRLRHLEFSNTTGRSPAKNLPRNDGWRKMLFFEFDEVCGDLVLQKDRGGKVPGPGQGARHPAKI